MGRWLPELSKVVWGSNQTATEMVLPYAIDDHASGQRVVSRCDRICQLQAAASFRKGWWCVAAEHFEESPRCCLSLVCWVSTYHDLQVGRV